MNLFLIILTLIIPFFMIFFGMVLTFRTPGFRSSLPAYSSERARQNADTWHYANYSFGVVNIFAGVYVAAATGLTDAILNKILGGISWLTALIIIAVQVLCMLFPKYYTEHQLKIFFDEKGEPLYPERMSFKNRKKEEEWEDWDKWPGDEEEEDGWEDWETWLRKRDMELDRQREARLAAGDTDSHDGPEAADRDDAEHEGEREADK